MSFTVLSWQEAKARAQLGESAAKWMIPSALTEHWWNQQWEWIRSSLQLDQKDVLQKPLHKSGVSLRRDLRKSTSPTWTGHTDLERGFVLCQSSPSASSLNTRRCKNQKYVLHNITESFCLPHLTKLNQYKNNTNKHTLAEEPWWENQGEITSSQKFLQLPKIPRVWKYTRDHRWALWGS